MKSPGGGIPPYELNKVLGRVTLRPLMEEDRLYFVAIGGPPLLGILLAKQMHAPAIAYVVEDGTIAPQMPMPTPPFMIGAGLASSRADSSSGRRSRTVATRGSY